MEAEDMLIERKENMSELSEMKCTACRGGEPTLTHAEMVELRPQVPEWQVVQREGIERLERMFRFRNFAQALAFTNRVGEQAEEERSEERRVGTERKGGGGGWVARSDT